MKRDSSNLRLPVMIGLLPRLALLLWIGFVIVAGASLADAESSAVEASQGASQPPDFDALREESRTQITRLMADVASYKAAQGPVPKLLVQELGLWQQFELLNQERSSIYEDLAKHRTDEANSQSASPQAFPGSFLELDALRDRVDRQTQDLQALQMELQMEKSLTSDARDEFETAEKQRRRLLEELDNSAPAQRLAQKQAKGVTELRSRVLHARLNSHREQVELMELHIEEAEEQLASLENVVEACAGRFQVTRDELDGRLAYIEEREKAVRDQLAQIDLRLRMAVYDHSASENSSHSTAYEVAREESQLLRQLLSGASQFKDAWRRRYLLSTGQVSADEVRSWLDETEQICQRIAQVGEKLSVRTRQRQEALSLLQRSALTDDENAVAMDSAETENERKELERIIDFYGSFQLLVSGGERLCQRLIEDLKNHQNQFSLADKLALAQGLIGSTWSYEFATIEDEPITVSKLVTGLFLLLCGYFLSRAFASMVAFRVLPRFGVSHSAAAVLRTVLFYLSLAALGLISLDVINVPLTVFAFLGGAVAIGVGFGSQNLINNFISGLILLVERPIRVGDLVNVDGIDANVEHVGARSTRIRTGENLEILVPNSKFLENNVTNWTLSDTRIRTSVSVGVAYGSPVRDVIDHLHMVIRSTEGALASPEPIVLFKDFGDNSLGFEVHFWIQMRRIMDGEKVRSEVRAAIDDAFRASDICIAFPQRDVHIDMQAPLEVRLADSDNSSQSLLNLKRRPTRRAA